ncbi:MAG: hypothetical protein WC631_00410 [Candidatus Paceibacterota bacterium]|jgi:hypothetical protein
MAKRISTRRKASRSKKTQKRLAIKKVRLVSKKAARKAKLSKRIKKSK